ncbi:phosphate ABC transporter ATP-binding protein PstB [Brevibacillus laterosporus]|uniref:phosphate ABC transporter ATP-binding protein PstB n=1 Tax=Brevibacillus laterosporus TaxID=1465 RepID=UPI0026524619|nr:phosphate ABC transporter ATP-binding protein PstB [Brevibacillus laterosporus]MDN9012090.1 phosphate ABC transporter ATP-binding protein PstB [Brevibacillus laterosporus]MDO0943165.1 phosphate ABC transporter ATP-binding protein PstB [Brevibacillus laterosporus]
MPITIAQTKAIIEAEGLSVFYGDKHAVKNIHIQMERNTVTALIGPSGCGKSSFLRSINRMNEEIRGCRVTGRLLLDGANIYEASVKKEGLRQSVGMLFQRANPFQKSIYENIAFAPRYHGTTNKAELNHIVEESLRKAALWDEVKDRLNDSALALSGGQQQRLCLARAIAMKPGILLLDEPCSALDPISTSKIEELIIQLKHDYTIVIVTHNMHQAVRVADETAFFLMGELVEKASTDKLFNNPKQAETAEYLSGRFG